MLKCTEGTWKMFPDKKYRLSLMDKRLLNW